MQATDCKVWYKGETNPVLGYAIRNESMRWHRNIGPSNLTVATEWRCQLYNPAALAPVSIG